VRWINLTHASYWLHVKIASRIAYRTGCQSVSVHRVHGVVVQWQAGLTCHQQLVRLSRWSVSRSRVTTGCVPAIRTTRLIVRDQLGEAMRHCRVDWKCTTFYMSWHSVFHCQVLHFLVLHFVAPNALVPYPWSRMQCKLVVAEGCRNWSRLRPMGPAG